VMAGALQLEAVVAGSGFSPVRHGVLVRSNAADWIGRNELCMYILILIKNTSSGACFFSFFLSPIVS
jgi:hypothetical protein